MGYGVFCLPAFYPDFRVESAPFYASLRAQARQAEALGFGTFWLAEHHFHGFGGILPSPQVVIPALAAEAPRLRFGTAVALLPFHHPLRVAEDYATVDVLTEGRFEFGVGVGFQKLEADNFGVALETARERFRENLTVILRAWTEERLDYDGEYGRYHVPVVLPKPVQRPHPPVWVAATATPETFRWAGEQGYRMMVIGFLHDVAGHKERIALYRQAYRAAGHPPEGERVLGVWHVYVGSSAAEVRAVGARAMEGYFGAARRAQELAGVGREFHPYPAHGPVLAQTGQLRFEDLQARARVIMGEPAACRETLAYLQEELEFSDWAFVFAHVGLPYDAILRAMDRFASEVLGALRVSA
ncbi:MAG TPA: LLM class flavin-dependent oxidoreductase [Chloroflexota bacterium]|nr:LLM class flavin-dependent oxidoreductase [Chloroflexota bacterium]